MSENLVVRGRGRARWLGASVASALIVSFGVFGQAAAQGVAPDVGAGAGANVGIGAGDMGAGLEAGAGVNVGANAGEQPARPAPRNPEVNLDQVANATGTINMIDMQKREITLDNGQTYKVATNVDIEKVARGQKVTLSYNLEGAEHLVIKIAPPLAN